MGILIIHPKDESTDFLIPIYKDLDCEVIRKIPNKSVFRRKIIEADYIIFLGHGCADGLLDPKDYYRLIIDSKYVQFLRNKKCSYIWCNARDFVNKYKLQGFSTGMCISEYGEALFCKVPAQVGDVEKANEKLTLSLKNSLFTGDILKEFLKYYKPESSIEQYNLSEILK